MKTRLGFVVGFAISLTGCEEAPADAVTDDFEIAGIVEGFYGTPWSHNDRLDVLEFMGDVGLNAYFYAPKADPFHLTRWREPYPPEQWNQLRDLAVAAQSNDVTFWYAISPGLSMQYSSQTDYSALLSKIDSVATLGVRNFGLFLDDVPLELSNAEDVSTYGDLASAHVALINRLHTDFIQRGYQLAVTPTVYTSAWDSPAYINRLGADVHPDVYLIWTGPDVATSAITHEQSAAWSDRLRRRIILWDNYPVNDFAPWRLFLGPLRGRDPELPATHTGILSNPMNQAHASLIALFTLADYTSNPQDYDPDESWARALDFVFDESTGETLAPFFDLFGSYAADESFLDPLHFLRDTIDIAAVDGAVTSLETALSIARSGESPDVRTSHILNEIEPIVTRARRKINDLRSDSRYRASDGLLLYTNDEGIDVPVASAVNRTIDGSLSDWSSPTWYPLYGRVRGNVTFEADDNHLYIAIQAQVDDVSVRPGPRVGEGTHVGLILVNDVGSERISSQDLFLLIGPEGGETTDPHFLGSMKLDGFMAKWLADNENLTFTEFHITTFGAPVQPGLSAVAQGIAFASRRSATGFTTEIRLPHQSREHRMSLTVSSRTNGRMRSGSLSGRNFPVNPATFVRLHLPNQ